MADSLTDLLGEIRKTLRQYQLHHELRASAHEPDTEEYRASFAKAETNRILANKVDAEIARQAEQPSRLSLIALLAPLVKGTVIQRTSNAERYQWGVSVMYGDQHVLDHQPNDPIPGEPLFALLTAAKITAEADRRPALKLVE